MTKKLAVAAVAVMLAAGAVSTSQAVNNERGGLMGFIAGCCFGIRAGAQYNDGKELHWREWIALIVPIVPAVWNGIDGANGTTTADYQAKYGTTFY